MTDCPHTPPCDPTVWEAAPPLPRPECADSRSSTRSCPRASFFAHDPEEPLMPLSSAISRDTEMTNELRLNRSGSAAPIVPTACERDQWAIDRERYRLERERVRALPAADLTLQAVLEQLRISPAYARHWLHPGCSCNPFDDDPYLCDWARELGFTDQRFDGGGIG